MNYAEPQPLLAMLLKCIAKVQQVFVASVDTRGVLCFSGHIPRNYHNSTFGIVLFTADCTDFTDFGCAWSVHDLWIFVDRTDFFAAVAICLIER